MMDNKSLQVVIVNYRAAHLTINCIRSVVDHKVAALSQITVVDNHSPDQSIAILREAFPAVDVVAAGSNNGFGAGVNLGARQSTSEYMLVLNPDTYFESDTVSPIIGFLDRERDVGIVGLDLVNPDGTRQFSARRFYSLMDVAARRVDLLKTFMRRRIDDHLMVRSWVADLPFDAEWVMGTGLIIRRDMFDLVGGMDEGYFLYMEDVDICARIWKAGKRVVCMPGCCLTHAHQRASAKSPFGRESRMHLASLLRFARKFHISIIRQPGIARVIG